MENTMQHLVEQFLQKHLTNTPKSIPEKIKHWLFVANNTGDVYPDADAVELSRRRRNARNNVRRLARKHAALLPTIARALETER
jgi:hypothetical protein